MTTDRIFYGADHPQAGQLKETLVYADSAPQPLILGPEGVLNLLPAAVVKAISSSAASAAVVKRYEMFKRKPMWTKVEGISLFNDIEGAGLMNNAQNAAAVAAWPEA